MNCRVHSFAILLALVVIAVATFPKIGTAQTIDVKEAWLKRDCHDKGTSDHRLSNAEFEACLRKQIQSLPPLDKNRRELFGEKYDPAKYVECRTRPGNRNNSACDIYVLRRREWPEYWPDGAKRIKWPQAPKASVYRKGMTPKEYWEALCKAEAGEWIFRPESNVSGLFEIRPRSYATDSEQADRYVLEGAFLATDILDWPQPEHALVQPYGGKYDFIERLGEKAVGIVRIARIHPSQAKEKWQTGRDGKYVMVPMVLQHTPTTRARSSFGYTWRGIDRERDREHGISGGEMIVADLRSGEILGIRRGFSFTGQSSVPRVNWKTALRCPSIDSPAPNAAFVYRVLRPRPDTNDVFHQWER